MYVKISEGLAFREYIESSSWDDGRGFGEVDAPCDTGDGVLVERVDDHEVIEHEVGAVEVESLVPVEKTAADEVNVHLAAEDELGSVCTEFVSRVEITIEQ